MLLPKRILEHLWTGNGVIFKKPRPLGFDTNILPSGKLTWQGKMNVLKMYPLLNMGIFHCYVSFPEGSISYGANFPFSETFLQP